VSNDARVENGEPELDEPPPLLGSWQRLYAVVIFDLLLCTALLYALTRWAR
jgi:hypothetical protein